MPLHLPLPSPPPTARHTHTCCLCQALAGAEAGSLMRLPGSAGEPQCRPPRSMPPDQRQLALCHCWCVGCQAGCRCCWPAVAAHEPQDRAAGQAVPALHVRFGSPTSGQQGCWGPCWPAPSLQPPQGWAGMPQPLLAEARAAAHWPRALTPGCRRSAAQKVAGPVAAQPLEPGPRPLLAARPPRCQLPPCRVLVALPPPCTHPC